MDGGEDICESLDADRAARLVAVLLTTDASDLAGFYRRCVRDGDTFDLDGLRVARELLAVIGTVITSEDPDAWSRLREAHTALITTDARSALEPDPKNPWELPPLSEPAASPGPTAPAPTVVSSAPVDPASLTPASLAPASPAPHVEVDEEPISSSTVQMRAVQIPASPLPFHDSHKAPPPSGQHAELSLDSGATLDDDAPLHAISEGALPFGGEHAPSPDDVEHHASMTLDDDAPTSAPYESQATPESVLPFSAAPASSEDLVPASNEDESDMPTQHIVLPFKQRNVAREGEVSLETYSKLYAEIQLQPEHVDRLLAEAGLDAASYRNAKRSWTRRVKRDPEVRRRFIDLVAEHTAQQGPHDAEDNT